MPAWTKKVPPKTTRKILERIGRLREKNSRVAQDYRIEVIADADKNNAIALSGSVNSKAIKKISTAVSTA